MKKKIIIGMMAFCMAVSLAACANAKTDAKESGSAESEIDAGKDSAAGDKGSMENASGKNGAEKESSAELTLSGEGAGDGSTEETGLEEYLLYSYETSGVMYAVNGDGNKIAEYNIKEVMERLSEQGYNVYDNSFMAAENGVLYFSNYEQIGDRWGQRFYAVNAATGEVKLLWTPDKDWYLRALDYYNGKIYLLAENGTAHKEIVFVRNAKTLDFTVEKNNLEAFLQAASGYELIYYSAGFLNNFQNYQYSSLTRTMEEVGFVIGKADDVFVRISADGTVSEIPGMDGSKGYLYVVGYDDTAVVYSIYNMDTMKTNYYCLTFEGGSIREIPWSEKLSVIKYFDRKLYYAETDGEEYGMETTSVYEYNCADRAVKVLYEKQSVPGTAGMNLGTEGFRIIGGYIFLEDVVGEEIKWVRAAVDDTKAGFTDTGCTVRTIDAFQFGSVIYASKTVNCPYCGIPLEKVYEEAFVLSPKYSQHADQINAYLQAELENTVQETGTLSEEFTDENCEYHREYPEQWCETVDSNVSGVSILEDRFLVVNMSGYWYGGGAHGYPSVSQTLFDLATGEKVGIRDLYTGTEEEFKQLVAEKTKEDFLGYDFEASPYFAQDADSVYEAAYESAGLDVSLLMFAEDGVTLLYPPYEMGPYASGYIEIHFSYEELFGRSGIAAD